MSSALYYEDLSGDDHDEGHSRCSDIDEESLDEKLSKKIKASVPGRTVVAGGLQTLDCNNDHEHVVVRQAKKNGLMRCIVHVDVDCFYCQCESMDRKIPTDRPFAIGQKHIIVTCNYVARQQYGISKLQLRQEALKQCPHLLIVEGSDLENYRKHARNIYTSFRKACKSMFANRSVAICKGSMDEMMADFSSLLYDDPSELTDALDCGPHLNGAAATEISSGTLYIYGSQMHERTVMTEDQTGAQTVVIHSGTFDHSRSEGLEWAGTIFDRDLLQQQLQRAAHVANRIRQQVLEETGFTTTMGISVNPLLAKIASGLRKPASVNLLYPWHGRHLLAGMPLRKVPGLGRRMYKALEPCLRQRHDTVNDPSLQHSERSSSSSSCWTCGDLLQVPVDRIQDCIKSVPIMEKSSAELTRMIIGKCRGIDLTGIEDDNGGLPKTVSVENSFRRGTIRSMAILQEAIETLYERLPRLLLDRANWSPMPARAYPTLIRLTIRSVVCDDGNDDGHGAASIDPRTSTKALDRPHRRLPTVTRSKQCRLTSGPSLLEFQGSCCKGVHHQAPSMLRQEVQPLLQSLMGNFRTTSSGFNVTRINVAVADFQDLLNDTRKDSPAGVNRIDSYFASQLTPSKQIACAPLAAHEYVVSPGSAACVNDPRANAYIDDTASATQTTTVQTSTISKSTGQISLPQNHRLELSSRDTSLRDQLDNGSTSIDFSVLSKLPNDMAPDIRLRWSHAKLANKKRKTISDFFAKRL